MNNILQDPVQIRGPRATMLHLMGIDLERWRQRHPRCASGRTAKGLVVEKGFHA